MIPHTTALDKHNIQELREVSAGLRVLLMMYKSLEDKSRFKLSNVSEDVRELLSVTGFDQFF